MKHKTGNLDQDPQEWLEELFEHEYCEECGGDAQHHTAVPLMGNWFARCDYPMEEGGGWHPVVKQFRIEEHNKGGTRTTKPPKCKHCPEYLSGLSDRIFCITHQCGPKEPCGKSNCPHCMGQKEVAP